MSDLLRVERDEHLLVWTLQRPEVLNAFNRPLLRTLMSEAERARHDRSIRCVIVTGAGERAFSAGADLKERRGMSLDDTREYVHLIRTTFDAVARLPFPTIAAVNGMAFGGGMELLLACDLRVMAESARVGLTETSIGVMPGAGGTQRLPRLIGVTRAKELIFSARRVGAEEALRLGLVNRVVATEEVLAAAKQMAHEIAAQAPLAVRASKHAIDAGLDAGIAAGLDIEASAYALLLPTQDRLEGLRAFAEKRPPKYRGE
ncbi:MAG: enoyl-CoA hydratase/isomerase family protein [Candidatus Latescibacterota bacterium]|nr:MAG: enoyl-CoA hydratase/isomerase family protein [Candidatus Latescibacterota bacterium]